MKAYLPMDKPDWKKKEDYAYLDGEDRREVWAWEFLRRLPEYRIAWQEFQKELKNNKDFVAYDPPRLDGESKHAWFMRCESIGVNARSLNFSQYAGLVWHLYDIVNPDKFYEQGVAFLPSPNIPASINFPDDLDKYMQFIEGDDFDHHIVHPDYCVIAFDLKASWNSQIEKAKKLFDARREEKKSNDYEKPHTDKGNKWVRYIRALDGVAAGASNKEIGEELKEKHINLGPAESGAEFVDSAKKMAANYKKILFIFVNKPE